MLASRTTIYIYPERRFWLFSTTVPQWYLYLTLESISNGGDFGSCAKVLFWVKLKFKCLNTVFWDLIYIACYTCKWYTMETGNSPHGTLSCRTNSPHGKCEENMWKMWRNNVVFCRILCYFVAESFYCDLRCFIAKYVSSRFTRFCVEKICLTKIARGEKMTNMRYASLVPIYITSSFITIQFNWFQASAYHL